MMGFCLVCLFLDHLMFNNNKVLFLFIICRFAVLGWILTDLKVRNAIRICDFVIVLVLGFLRKCILNIGVRRQQMSHMGVYGCIQVHMNAHGYTLRTLMEAPLYAGPHPIPGPTLFLAPTSFPGHTPTVFQGPTFFPASPRTNS